MRSCFLSFGLSWSSRTYPRWLRCGKDGCLRPFNSLPASRPAGESRPRGGTAATWTPPPLAKGKMLFCCQCLQLDFGVGLPPSKKSLQKNEYSSREDFASYLPPGWLNLAPVLGQLERTAPTSAPPLHEQPAMCGASLPKGSSAACKLLRGTGCFGRARGFAILAQLHELFRSAWAPAEQSPTLAALAYTLS